MSIQEPARYEIGSSANLLYANQQSGWQGMVKSVLDKAAALVGIVVLSPLLIGIAVAIKLDSRGPVFYKQSRHGCRNQVFGIWKFRTMTVVESDGEVRQAKTNDKRITRIGRFLRKSSIDELPQLINVLSGEMSLVGPRPHPLNLNYEFAPLVRNYWARHAVKPGLTGHAQVRGYRGPTDTVEKMQLRVDHDLEYIENWSLWTDFKILIATPFFILSGKNAF